MKPYDLIIVVGQGITFVFKHCEKFKINLFDLPKAYRNLGKEIYNSKIQMNGFDNIFSQISQIGNEKNHLFVSKKLESGFKEIIRKFANFVKDLFKWIFLKLKERQLLLELGNFAYKDKKALIYHLNSTKLLSVTLDKLCKLKEEIINLGEVKKESIINPRNTALIFAGIFGIIFCYISCKLFVPQKNLDLEINANNQSFFIARNSPIGIISTNKFSIPVPPKPLNTNLSNLEDKPKDKTEITIGAQKNEFRSTSENKVLNNAPNNLEKELEKLKEKQEELFRKSIEDSYEQEKSYAQFQAKANDSLREKLQKNKLLRRVLPKELIEPIKKLENLPALVELKDENGVLSINKVYLHGNKGVGIDALNNLENLETVIFLEPIETFEDLMPLSGVQNISICLGSNFKDIPKVFPNLKKMEILGGRLSKYSLEPISRLSKLETLNINSLFLNGMDNEEIALPKNLKKIWITIKSIENKYQKSDVNDSYLKAFFEKRKYEYVRIDEGGFSTENCFVSSLEKLLEVLACETLDLRNLDGLTETRIKSIINNNDIKLTNVKGPNFRHILKGLSVSDLRQIKKKDKIFLLDEKVPDFNKRDLDDIFKMPDDQNNPFSYMYSKITNLKPTNEFTLYDKILEIAEILKSRKIKPGDSIEDVVSVIGQPTEAYFDCWLDVIQNPENRKTVLETFSSYFYFSRYLNDLKKNVDYCVWKLDEENNVFIKLGFTDGKLDATKIEIKLKSKIEIEDFSK
jgi:hypothetical protein